VTNSEYNFMEQGEELIGTTNCLKV
jgi:hypothetical protein